MTGEKNIEEKIVARLKEKGWQVTCAESCTGGMIASTLVNVAGVSDVFMESYVTYANDSKHKLVGVSKEALATFGAVSWQVAEQMAKGAAKAASAQAAIAVTGIAGPAGGACVYWVLCRGKDCCHRESFSGKPDGNQKKDDAGSAYTFVPVSCIKECRFMRTDSRRLRAGLQGEYT